MKDPTSNFSLLSKISEKLLMKMEVTTLIEKIFQEVFRVVSRM